MSFYPEDQKKFEELQKKYGLKPKDMMKVIMRRAYEQI